MKNELVTQSSYDSRQPIPVSEDLARSWGLPEEVRMSRIVKTRDMRPAEFRAFAASELAAYFLEMPHSSTAHLRAVRLISEAFASDQIELNIIGERALRAVATRFHPQAEHARRETNWRNPHFGNVVLEAAVQFDMITLDPTIIQTIRNASPAERYVTVNTVVSHLDQWNLNNARNGQALPAHAYEAERYGVEAFLLHERD